MPIVIDTDHLLANWRTSAQSLLTAIIGLSAVAPGITSLSPKWAAGIVSAGAVAKVVLGMFQKTLESRWQLCRAKPSLSRWTVTNCRMTRLQNLLPQMRITLPWFGRNPQAPAKLASVEVHAQTSSPQPVAEQPAKAGGRSTAMATVSVLSNITTKLKSFFTGTLKVAEEVTGIAQKAEPFVDLGLSIAGLAPVATLFNNVTTAAGQAELAAAAAGQQNGTGAQKAALVLQSVYASFEAAAQQNGWEVPDQATVSKFVDLTVQAMQLLKPAATT